MFSTQTYPVCTMKIVNDDELCHAPLQLKWFIKHIYFISVFLFSGRLKNDFLCAACEKKLLLLPRWWRRLIIILYNFLMCISKSLSVRFFNAVDDLFLWMASRIFMIDACDDVPLIWCCAYFYFFRRMYLGWCFVMIINFWRLYLIS